MNAALPLRRWVARYGRWIATAGAMLMIHGGIYRHYGLASVGLATMAFASWGLLLDADLPNRPKALRRGNLTFLMWWGAVGAVFAAGLALWIHLDPQG